MDYYHIIGCPGIAFVVLGPTRVWEPEHFVLESEDGEEILEPTGDGKWVDGDGSVLRVRMVGDDREMEIAAGDCRPLEGGFCLECGQIGCGWHPAEE